MERYLKREILALALNRNKMAFVSGPRQVGKTTLAKDLMKKFDESQYKNWDESEFRKLWTKSPNSIKEKFELHQNNLERILVLDEIHKSKGWKQKLKGIFDELSEELKIIVTGSARLNVFKRGGDSLLGRYLNFRLHPLSYGELSSKKILSPEDWKRQLFIKSSKKFSHEILENLFKFSGFPEPYFSKSPKILNIWRAGRNEKIIREDLRDISRIPELSQVEMLVSLLPEKIGSPLSVQSLREDLEVSHDAVTRWLGYLSELYFYFELKPWSKSIPRSLKKEGKIYLYDWTEIPNDGAKFENLIACQLLKSCHFWTDTGEGDFQLYYLRNKEKQEIDFLIVKNKKPWIAIESKLSETNIDLKSTRKFLDYLKCPFVQIVKDEGVFRVNEDVALMSAGRAFFGLP
jgi:predicted AAA+ superfamily ATPase